MPKDMLWIKLNRVLLSWDDSWVTSGESLRGLMRQVIAKGVSTLSSHIPERNMVGYRLREKNVLNGSTFHSFCWRSVIVSSEGLVSQSQEKKKKSCFDCNLLIAQLAEEWEMSKSLSTSL